MSIKRKHNQHKQQRLQNTVINPDNLHIMAKSINQLTVQSNDVSLFTKWNNSLHLPLSTGVQQDYTQCSVLFLHAQHHPLHTDAVFRSIRLWSIDSYQVIPPSVLIPMTRIIEKACQQRSNRTANNCNRHMFKCSYSAIVGWILSNVWSRSQHQETRSWLIPLQYILHISKRTHIWIFVSLWARKQWHIIITFFIINEIISTIAPKLYVCCFTAVKMAMSSYFQGSCNHDWIWKWSSFRKK